MNNKKGLTDIEQEKEMYTICFAILAICLISLLVLSGNVQFSIFNGQIAGAVVLEQNISQEELIIDYKNISFENITQELAFNALLQAERDMLEMQGNGFGVVWVNDSLIEAKKYFKGEDYTSLLKEIWRIKDNKTRENAQNLLIGAQKRIGVNVDYKKVLEKTKAINERKVKAYEINDYIVASELRIKEMEKTGLNMSGALDILNSAKIEFKEERYDNAIKLLAQIEPKIDEIKSENNLVKTIYRAGKETTLNFIKEHYIAIIISFTVLIIIFLLSYNRVMVIILNKKIDDMNIEKEVLDDLMRKSQSDYYSKVVIPKKTYDIKINAYKERMLQIKQQMPVVEARLEKLSKMKRIV